MQRNDAYRLQCMRAQQELCSLLSDGYRLMFEWQNHQKESWYVSLRHQRNRNRALIRVNRDGAELFINGEKRKDI